MTLPERQRARKESIAASALAIHGYIRLARRFYDDATLSLDLLDALGDGDYFKLTNPHWQDRGIVTKDVNKSGQTVLSVRNALQTRRAMTDALAAKVGLIPDPLTTAEGSEGAVTAA